MIAIHKPTLQSSNFSYTTRSCQLWIPLPIVPATVIECWTTKRSTYINYAEVASCCYYSLYNAPNFSRLRECKTLWGLPELLLMPIVYARNALVLSIFLALFSSLRCVHTEGWCGCMYVCSCWRPLCMLVAMLLHSQSVYIQHSWLYAHEGPTSRAVWVPHTCGLLTLK